MRLICEAADTVREAQVSKRTNVGNGENTLLVISRMVSSRSLCDGSTLGRGPGKSRADIK